MNISDKRTKHMPDKLPVKYEFIAEQIIRRLEEALKNSDCDLWVNTIYTEDTIANEAQRIWFYGYILKPNPNNINIKTLSVVHNSSSIVVDCSLRFEYEKFNAVNEVHRYTIEFVEKLDDWRIIWLEKIPSYFETDLSKVHKPFDLTVKNKKDDGFWWEKEDFIKLVKESRDPLSPLVYARAIPRNVRFREAHPLIECAALLVNMMSENTSHLALQVFDTDELQMLANLYNASKERIFVRLVRPDRDNTWASKFLAPWYGIDEMLSLMDESGAIIGNCSPIMSLYFAILRLCGFKSDSLYQLRMHNQDAILVNIDAKVYILSSDMLEEFTEKTLYHNTRVTKLYNDKLIWTSLGVTNIPETNRKRLSEYFRNSIPNLIFPDEVKESALPPAFWPDYGFPSFFEINDPLLLSRKVKEHVLKLSNEYPESSCTWAKYGYQTLYVLKPETYAVWSLQSPLVQEFAKECSSFDQLLAVLKDYKRESIFSEADRIMTADQVIRNRKGDSKSLALLMFTWLTLSDNKEGVVLFTSKCCYCGWIDNSVWKYWDFENENEVSIPEGRIILAFDNKYSYCPAINRKTECKEEPLWMNMIEKLQGVI